MSRECAIDAHSRARSFVKRSLAKTNAKTNAEVERARASTRREVCVVAVGATVVWGKPNARATELRFDERASERDERTNERTNERRNGGDARGMEGMKTREGD